MIGADIFSINMVAVKKKTYIHVRLGNRYVFCEDEGILDSLTVSSMEEGRCMACGCS